MPDSHLKFHSSNGKRRILIVDDELINREILGAVLEEQYETLFAENGEEALIKVREHRETLSLVLLDLLLPDMHGLEILQRIKSDPQLAGIPVIVMTADKEAEVESLTYGAIDFIPKPYPVPKVILARVLRTIELSEDRDIIHWTERDQLTGLYNREYFYRYAEQFDMYHKDMAMDAIVVDINRFHMINERYGKMYGDEILRRIGEKVRAIVVDSGGIVCRREADTFLVYCPHRSDYSEILDNASMDLSLTTGSESRVRLRMGVYSDVDKSIDIERRFDRAKMAADTVRSTFTKAIAIYDDTLHESEIFEEQLLEDFVRAIEEKQFTVLYQPKFNIRPDEPLLASAEALVRWKHPELGMISPGLFIPLFEKNGLIERLDSYVWNEAAVQIRRWKEKLGITIPVSVNVSRIDMYDPELVSNLQKLVRENGLTASQILLEITESAYTQDSEQIISTVNRLRSVGFKVEMDDFGSGYSSLNMISTLPIDALKLDMQFIRNAFKERKDTRMLEIVIEIADSLSVPTIAEGVETAEQLFTLRAMGCDIVQGYYFSRPVTPEEFEPFLIKKKEREETAAAGKELISPEEGSDLFKTRLKIKGDYTYNALHDPLTGLYNHSAYEMLLRDADQTHIAVLIADIDDFAAKKEEYGAEKTERVIRLAANVLRSSFRSVDFICRIREDEFVVIMTRVGKAMQQMIFEKIVQINDALLHPGDDLPPISFSVGVAFGDRDDQEGDIFQAADAALARALSGGSCRYEVF